MRHQSLSQSVGIVYGMTPKARVNASRISDALWATIEPVLLPPTTVDRVKAQ